MPLDRLIARCFNETFALAHRCVLVGGAPEPLYIPSPGGPHRAVLRYRQDFAASALHESAHWCIAGAERRRQLDFGYWYRPPPRSRAQQDRFIAVEAPVQALERRFAEALGLEFKPSIDDVDATDSSTIERFREAIETAANSGFPPRGEQFVAALEGLQWSR